MRSRAHLLLLLSARRTAPGRKATAVRAERGAWGRSGRDLTRGKFAWPPTLCFCSVLREIDTIPLLQQLFATELREIHFPDVDASSLAAHQAAVETAAKSVEEAELALARAAGELQEHKRALARHGQRALAYVRIYAEQHPELQERLEGLNPRRKANDVVSTDPPRKRGRPRGLGEEQPQLAAVGE